MTDKERILTYIIQRFYPKYLLHIYDDENLFNKCNYNNIKNGDLVLAITSGTHDFSIGYVTRIISESEMIIREIGSNKTCRIGNEMFYKIDLEKLDSDMLLEGLQYDIYIKVKKAINKATEYYTRYHSIEFVEGLFKCCKFHLRKAFSNNIIKSFTFKYSSKTTIKEIVELIKNN